MQHTYKLKFKKIRMKLISLKKNQFAIKEIEVYSPFTCTYFISTEFLICSCTSHSVKLNIQ